MSLRRKLTTRPIVKTGKGEFKGGGFTVVLSKVGDDDVVSVEVDGCWYSWPTFDVETFDEQRARLAAEVGFRRHFSLMNGDPSMYDENKLRALRKRREESAA